jgi:signal transduction histidine kinase
MSERPASRALSSSHLVSIAPWRRPAGAGRDVPAEAVARAVHDVASPLTVLVGLCFALRRRVADPAVIAGIGRIEGEVERISDRLDALVALARGGGERITARRSPVSLVALAREVLARASVLAESTDTRLQLELGCDPLIVDGDARSLESAVDNLVRNAVRHAGRGGTVWVAAATWGGEAVLHVADDGPGVHPDERERIFRPHVRGRGATGPGQGLGLAIARDTARAHGGTLVLEPSDSGAVFRLGVPLAASPAGGPGRDAA